MGLLLAFLKMLGTAAAKGAVGLGKVALTGAKAVGKGAIEAGKWGLGRMQQGAKAGEPLSTNELVKAFGSLLTPSVEAAQLPTPAEQPYSQLPNMVVPGPGGQPIQGQGEAMPGYEMQPPRYNIPEVYRQMMPQTQGQPIQSRIPPQYQGYGQQPSRYPGVFAGLKEGLLGMPSTAGEPQPYEKGRQTAYYAGKLIPDIVRSKMGVSTTGEEARQQQLLEAYGLKKYTPEFKKDLTEAIDRIPTLDESQKIYLYQQLAIQYPEKSTELKRIFFPQSQDDLALIYSMINAGK